jgi:hypothetical protein
VAGTGVLLDLDREHVDVWHLFVEVLDDGLDLGGDVIGDEE